MLPLALRQGRFTFRFEQVDRQLRVWVAIADLGDFGPVTLMRAEADEVGTLLERLMSILAEAYQRSEAPAAPETEPPREGHDWMPKVRAVRAARRSTTGHPTSKAPSLQAPARKRRAN